MALDVQTVLDRYDENGGYADRMDYHRPPSAPRSSHEPTRMDGLLRRKGLR